MYFAHFENISRCGTSEYDHETAASRKWRPREGHSDESYPVQVVAPVPGFQIGAGGALPGSGTFRETSSG